MFIVRKQNNEQNAIPPTLLGWCKGTHWTVSCTDEVQPLFAPNTGLAELRLRIAARLRNAPRPEPYCEAQGDEGIADTPEDRRVHTGKEGQPDQPEFGRRHSSPRYHLRDFIAALKRSGRLTLRGGWSDPASDRSIVNSNAILNLISQSFLEYWNLSITRIKILKFWFKRI